MAAASSFFTVVPPCFDLGFGRSGRRGLGLRGTLEKLVIAGLGVGDGARHDIGVAAADEEPDRAGDRSGDVGHSGVVLSLAERSLACLDEAEAAQFDPASVMLEIARGQHQLASGTRKTRLLGMDNLALPGDPGRQDFHPVDQHGVHQPDRKGLAGLADL